jgi:predicted alpha/beta hydrolase
MRSNNTIRTNDGTRIWISCYAPERSNEKIVVIAPGFGLTHDDYDPFASFFCNHGFTVIAFDYRGVGNSAPKKLSGFAASIHQWAVQDINAVLLYTKHHYQKQELIYIGHNIGGEIIGLAPASQYINRIVLVSSALSCAKLWPWRDKIKIEGLKVLARMSSAVLGYFPGRSFNLFGDLPRGVIHEWASWCDNSNGLFDNFPDNNYRKLNVPMLAFTFSDDWHCPPRAVKELLSKFENSTITWYHMKPKDIGMKKIGHIDFFYSRMKATLWESLLEWINKDDRKLAKEKGIRIKRTISE